MHDESSNSLPAQWLSKTHDLSGRASASLAPAVRRIGEPANLRRLRIVAVALLGAWLLYSLARIVWALAVPAEPLAATAAVINPVQQPARAAGPAQVNIEVMRGWHLFGEVGADAPPVVQPVVPQTTSGSARDGIEDGARETRLQLKLRGVVASTEDGLGHAVIEHRNKQAVYAVEDKLPVSGRVTLAKVMPRQVVLDNGGTYELLTLFEASDLGVPVAPASVPKPASQPAAKAKVDMRSDAQATQLASGYRERLYQNPTSLAEVVNVAAVRSDGELRGYRIAPGKDKDQFKQLGFKSGDLVTSVNGIALNDPANTMRLYQTLRTASEAVFELERGDQPVSITVSLGEAQAQ